MIQVARTWAVVVRRVRHPGSLHLLLGIAQLIIVWGMWSRRDLTYGDTSSYFLDAAGWARDRTLNILWSPLYTTFYGCFLDAGGDPDPGTTLHRIAIYLIAGQLVLWVCRRLLTPVLAWWVAVWWCCNPITADALYEVHLFAFIPTLVVWLVAGRARTPIGRGTVMALLLLTTLLVRNELSVALGCWVVLCAAKELRAREGVSWLRIAGSYGLPLVLALGVVLATYSRSTVRDRATLDRALEAKHTLNMAQVYCAGYQQRNPEWTHSPWTEYAGLTTATFGKPLPSLRDMLTTNPWATLEHFRWNLALTPAGLQVLLFNATHRTHNPDYVPVQTERPRALYLSLVVLAVWAGALVELRRRGPRWRAWVRRRRPLLSAMACVLVTSIPVILTQRPRPSYLFPLGLALMIATGLAVQVLLGRAPRRVRSSWLWLPLLPLFAATVPWLCRPYGDGSRPLARVVSSLMPFRDLIRRPTTVFVKGEYAGEVGHYVGQARGQVQGYELLRSWDRATSLASHLERAGVNLLYLDETRLHELEALPPTITLPFTAELPSGNGWRRLAAVDSSAGRWRLYERVDPR